MESKWICAILSALVAGICLGVYVPQQPAQEPAAEVFAAYTEENLFAVGTPAPDDGFAIEVIGMATPAPPKRVLIYHTHTYEAYEQTGERYKETEKWRTAENEHNVVRVGEELAALLRSHGMEVVHDALSRIHKRDCELLRMKYFERLSDEDIAQRLEIGVASVRFYLTKARRNFAKELKRREEA